MKITSITCHLLSGRWTGDPAFPHDVHATAFVEIDTDEGVSGLGEISLGYFAPEAVVSLVDYFKPVLIGRDPMQITRLARAMESDAVWWSRSGAGRSVIGGLEMALWDMAGKALGVPVYQLLGGAVRDTIPVYASGGPSCWPPEANVEKLEFYREPRLSCREAVDELLQFDGRRGIGFTPAAGTGTATTRSEAQTNRRKASSDCADISATNSTWRSTGTKGLSPNPIPVQEAIEIAQALAPYRLVFYEEPLPYTDVAGYCELRSRSRVPIAAGESLSGVDQFHPFIAGTRRSSRAAGSRICRRHRRDRENLAPRRGPRHLGGHPHRRMRRAGHGGVVARRRGLRVGQMA